MIYLDTHVVVWLYAGELERFEDEGLSLLRDNELAISPIVLLELQYLHEINRITVSPAEIVDDLFSRIGLSICDKDFVTIVNRALSLAWTRDPFDRILVAHADIDGNVLVSKDLDIRNHYQHARW